MLTEQKGVIDDAKRKALSAAATVTGAVPVAATADGERRTADGERLTADGERLTVTATATVAVSANHRRLCLDVLI